MSELGLLDGRYQLLHELGRGAFGSVHLAAQKVLGEPVREVAVKVFHGDFVTAENMRDKMNDAFQLVGLLAKLADWRIRQHFLTIFDLGVSRGSNPQAFIVMELVSGGNLGKRIKRGRFTPAACLHYLRQMCRALGFMHQCSPPIVHSDLKPENILLFQGAEDDLVKIGDFGLAGTYHGSFAAGPRGGTLAYLAPEMLYNMATTPAADVFSLGLIAHEMLTGENPFSDVGSTLDRESPSFMDDLVALHREARKNQVALAAKDFQVGVGDSPALASLIDVVNCMLANDLSRRYRNAQEVSDELERIAAGGFALGRSGAQLPLPVAPSRADARLDPLTVLQQEVAYHLDRQQWPAASAAVRKVEELLRSQPGEGDLPYRLRAQIYKKQAAANPAIAKHSLTSAAQALERGLGACLGAPERTRLEAELASVKKELGIQ